MELIWIYEKKLILFVIQYCSDKTHKYSYTTADRKSKGTLYTKNQNHQYRWRLFLFHCFFYFVPVYRLCMCSSVVQQTLWNVKIIVFSVEYRETCMQRRQRVLPSFPPPSLQLLFWTQKLYKKCYTVEPSWNVVNRQSRRENRYLSLLLKWEGRCGNDDDDDDAFINS